MVILWCVKENKPPQNMYKKDGTWFCSECNCPLEARIKVKCIECKYNCNNRQAGTESGCLQRRH